MAITNAQQYQQLVNKPASGKRPGYAGRDRDFQQRGASKSDYAKTSQSYKDSGTQQVYDGSKNTSSNDPFVPTIPSEAPKAPPKKPKKTKYNYKKSSKFTTPTLAAIDFVGQGIKNSKLGRYLNTKAREDYLENLKEEDNELYQQTVDDLAKLGYATRDVELYGPKSKGAGKDIETFTDLYEDQAKSILNTVTDSPDGGVGTLYDDYLDEKMNRFTPDNDGGGQQQDPCLGPNPPAYCFVGNDTTEEDVTPTRNLGGLAPRFAGSIFDFTGLADGGRAGKMDGGMMEDTPEGGIMDLESGRQMYFLGKLVKKATRAVKKVAKSPFGKMALLGLGAGMAGFGPAKGLFASGKGLGFKKFLTDSIMGKAIGVDSPAGGGGIIRSGGLLNFMKDNPYLSILGGSSILAGLSGKGEDEGEIDYGPGIDIDRLRYAPYRTLAPGIIGSNYQTGTEGRKDGGRMGYQEGGDAEPVAKKTMPLLDMDGMEKDYREDGGFVPIGRMERADDVPARLSKNEFVFTADAVRNAGEGDIDKGAEVMYNMMKNLESGGEVSEESQGLDGAKEMFKTSQRLEEVL
jgi:hypothetical protein